MLTATYSLVAIAAEQEKSRSLLNRLQHFVQASWKGLQTIDFGFIEAGCERMLQFDNFLQNRKITLHLVPVLKGVDRESDRLLAELEALRAKAGSVLRGIVARLGVRMELGRIEVSQLCDSMQVYCEQVSTRLQLEDQVLLPLARRLLSVEDWFRLAAAFLSRDGARRRPHMRNAPLRSPQAAGRSNDLH